MTMSQSDLNLERAAKIDIATLSDALDKLGIAGQCLGIKPLEHSFRLTGRSFTLEYGPVAVGGTVGDFIDDVPPGAVIVINNHGREDATVWGDILTTCARRRGINGTVIDGACRDTHLARELAYPIFSRSYSMRTGKDRVQLDAVNHAVKVGGARISPGAIMRGDSDGVVTIPLEDEMAVLDLAEGIQLAETMILQLVRDGSRLDEARRRQNYHLLQRREKT
jgi:4-hydroxy-4-methyl-2-oxoglutarate aldolase